MIGYNLERFANSTANLEHVTLYFDNLVEKNGEILVTFSSDLVLSGSDRLQNSEALLDLFWALLRTIDEPS